MLPVVVRKSPASREAMHHPPRHLHKHRKTTYRRCSIGSLVLLAVLAMYYIFGPLGVPSGMQRRGQSGRRNMARDGTLITDTLVIYIFSNTDPEYLDNLRFFVHFGVADGDGCDYIIVVQEEPGQEVCAANVEAGG
jgi:hypothetical protein